MKEKIKRCIFHLPNYIDVRGKSGSQVRPMKMKKAFENLGYSVDFIMGYGKQRKRAINQIKNNIKNGIKYDFCYSESSTMPTLLTEKNHFPLYPNLDFGFMKFCRKHGIKIGLFYRDMFWKFEQYRNVVPWYQRIVTVPMYKYDLFQYNRRLNVLYLTSQSVDKWVKECTKPRIRYLPPGSDVDENVILQRKEYFKNRKKNDITIFYVGGLSGIYDISVFMEAAKYKSYLKLIICCKEEEWKSQMHRYAPYITPRVKIVHAFGAELEKYYREADICACYFDTDRHSYMNMASPIKLFEYLAHLTPILATTGSNAADFVEKNQIGWHIEYSKEAFSDWIDGIYINQEEIVKKHENTIQALPNHTWEKRAAQVAKDLGNKTGGMK